MSKPSQKVPAYKERRLAKQRTAYRVVVQGDCSENTKRLIEDAIAQQAARPNR